MELTTRVRELAAWLFAAAAAGAGPAAAQPAEYHVRISVTPLEAHVRATLPVAGTRLAMDETQADHLPDGWATFVRDLTITDRAGRAIPFRRDTGAAWEMEGPHTGPVVVAYRVDLSFVRKAWPAGNEQAGFFDGDALYLVTKALFIADDAPGERRVTFDLPEGWKATTPWPRASGDSWTFPVADRTDLLRNSFVVGRHVEIRFEDGPFTLSLALPGSIAKAAATIEPALRRVVRAYGRLFDRTPRGRYLMTVFYAPQDDGEAFLHSSAFTRMSREWRASSPATISRGFSPAT